VTSETQMKIVAYHQRTNAQPVPKQLLHPS